MSDVLDLTIDRPAAGGRMLARHDGVIVLVSGAIPGERVHAEVERSSKHLLWAKTVEILEPSPSRRQPVTDQSCGGCDYAHMAYDAQRACKRDVVVDAFRRIGKMAIAHDVMVEPSREDGYRVRAYLHVRNRRAGFFLEGSHTLCDAAATGQLHPDAIMAVNALVDMLGADADACDGIITSENVRGDERVLHVELRQDAVLELDALPDGATGVTFGARSVQVAVGHPTVADRAKDLLSDLPLPPATTWRRHATSFFQANRYLTGPLLRYVLSLIPETAEVADLYAGVGLFAVACAARGARVIAIEGDRSSGVDLVANAEPFGDRLRVIRAPVEYTAGRVAVGTLGAVIVDPPRTGLSSAALPMVVSLGAPSLVYVSCDPATLARDSAALVAAGFRLASVRAFDLFPNTAHVEIVAAFER